MEFWVVDIPLFVGFNCFMFVGYCWIGWLVDRCCDLMLLGLLVGGDY